MIKKALIGTTLGILLVTLSLYVFIVFGPLSGIKELVVTTAMTTMSHQYLARFVASKAEVDNIMKLTAIAPPVENTHIELISQPSEPERPDLVTLTDISTTKYRGYILTITNPQRVTLGLSSKLGKIGDTLSNIVKQNQAIAGVNAGGFIDVGGVGTGGTPSGILLNNYEVLNPGSPGKSEVIGFTDKDVLIVGSYTLDELKKLNVRDAVSFGPFLVVNGEPMIKQGDGGWGLGPRTVIGQKSDGTVLMLVIDGRQVTSIGASMKDVQEIMLKHGAITAANLYGGSSTAMVYEGKLINHPCSLEEGRLLPSAFVVLQSDSEIGGRNLQLARSSKSMLNLQSENNEF